MTPCRNAELEAHILKNRRSVDFDAVASPYRWLEYLTFGRLLENLRFAQLRFVADKERALILGDGDGRFLARLVVQNPELRADAIDSSAEMLALSRTRISAAGADDRVRLIRADVADELFVPCGNGYDLVVTHFFLDCFTDCEVEAIVDRIMPTLAHGSVWMVSEFDVPLVGSRIFARVLIRLLYLSFGLLTGLSVRSLPVYRRVLEGRGFVLERRTTSMRGILVSELWRRANRLGR